jgi:hypothetical protein
MADRKPFLTLGNSKLGKFFGVIILLVIAFKIASKNELIPSVESIANDMITNTYHEVTVPSAWFNDYSEEFILELVNEYVGSVNSEALKNKLSEFEGVPKIGAEVYLDDVEGEPDLGWVVKFTVSTEKVGFTNSKVIADLLGTGFVDFIKENKEI